MDNVNINGEHKYKNQSVTEKVKKNKEKAIREIATVLGKF